MVVDMPLNSYPAMTTPELLDAKVNTHIGAAAAMTSSCGAATSSLLLSGTNEYFFQPGSLSFFRALLHQIQASSGKLHVKTALWGGLVPENAHKPEVRGDPKP